jgi:hypothetical protein
MNESRDMFVSMQSCVDKLDEAARADPEGDKNPDVQRTRAFAKKQLAP